MRFCSGSLKLDPHCTRTHAACHWTRRKPPSDPPSRLWWQSFETWFVPVPSFTLHCRGKKGGPVSPCSSSIFISQLAQAGIWGGWEFCSLFRRWKALATSWCVFSAGWHITGWQNRHPALIWWTRHSRDYLQNLTQMPILPPCKTSHCNLHWKTHWGRVPETTFLLALKVDT